VDIATRILGCSEDFVRCWPQIEDLRASCGLFDDVQLNPVHFLASTDLSRRSCSVGCFTGDRLIGLMYVTQHFLHGVGTGFGVGGDFVGRGLLLCATEDETFVLNAAIRCLIDSGIHSLHLRMQPRVECDLRGLPSNRYVTAWFDACIAGDRVGLPESFESLVSKFGRRTRKNISQHRRMCSDAGYRYVPQVSADQYAAAMQRLNAASPFPVTSHRQSRDERILALHQDLRVGMVGSDGTLVAVLCGFLRNERFYLLTQANDSSLARLSLSLVLRTYLMEHLIGIGVKQLQVTGGSSLALGRYFEPLNYRSIYVDARKGALAGIKCAVAALVRSMRAGARKSPRALEVFAGAFLRQHRDELKLHAPPAADPTQGAEKVTLATQ
jgi:hypothetical protein